MIKVNDWNQIVRELPNILEEKTNWTKENYEDNEG